MKQPPARLILRHGSLPEQDYALADQSISIIGREAINDIPLNDPEVSRRHARIEFVDGRYILEDLGSTNGTYLNGRRLTEPAPLKHTDIIEFGESLSFTFHIGAIDRTVVDAPAAVPGYEATAIEYPAPPEDSPMTQPIQQIAEAPGSVAMPAPTKPRRFSNRNLFLGCGCLLLLLALICVGGLVALDSLNPNLLYCNWLGFIFENTATCR